MTILYVGQTRGAETIKTLNEAGIRELTQRWSMPPLRMADGWALDNGCFEDFQKNQPFDYAQFERKGIWWIKNHLLFPKKDTPKHFKKPDFIVLPDKVAAGMESWKFSKDWWEGFGWPYEDLDLAWYFVVQNGMTPLELDLSFAPIKGIFVGGSLDWKLQTAPSWVQFAHERGLKCHIGRAATVDRITWARRIGADSIDGNGPLWTKEDLQAAIHALTEPLGQERGQFTLFAPDPPKPKSSRRKI